MNNVPQVILMLFQLIKKFKLLYPSWLIMLDKGWRKGHYVLRIKQIEMLHNMPAQSSPYHAVRDLNEDGIFDLSPDNNFHICTLTIDTTWIESCWAWLLMKFSSLALLRTSLIVKFDFASCSHKQWFDPKSFFKPILFICMIFWHYY